MKHLEKYKIFESHIFVDYIKDILIELSDDGVGYDVQLKGDGTEFTKFTSIVVILSSYKFELELRSIGHIIEHLFSYLESQGYVLGEDSFYENENWDYYERCPECMSRSVWFTERNDDKDINMWICGKCGGEGVQEDFQTPEHPISKGELLNSIKNNYYINFMYLEFKKK